MTNSELHAVLIAAFPPTPITRETIYTDDAGWSRYEERDALALLEGKSWPELTVEVLERHEALLIHAGATLFRATLPAYLFRLVEHEYSTILPFHVVSQLTRKDSNVDREVFDERVGPMTVEQRDAVRHAISLLAKQSVLREVASTALRSW